MSETELVAKLVAVLALLILLTACGGQAGDLESRYPQPAHHLEPIK